MCVNCVFMEYIDGLQVAEWTKEVSVIWRALTDSEKEPFDKLAAKDRARYVEQVNIDICGEPHVWLEM